MRLSLPGRESAVEFAQQSGKRHTSLRLAHPVQAATVSLEWPATSGPAHAEVDIDEDKPGLVPVHATIPPPVVLRPQHPNLANVDRKPNTQSSTRNDQTAHSTLHAQDQASASDAEHNTPLQPVNHHQVPKAFVYDLRKLLPTNTPHAAITFSIQSCDSCSAILDVVQKHQGRMNTVNLSAAFNRTCTLFKRSRISPMEMRIASTQLIPLLITELRRMKLDLHARAIATCLHAIASLDIRDAQLYKDLEAVSEQQMQDFTSRGLSQLIWAFAHSSCPPAPRWMELFLGACHSKLQQFDSQSMATVLWSLTRLRYRLSSSRQTEFLAKAKELLPSCSAQSLNMIAYSLGVNTIHPGQEWMELFEQTCLEGEGFKRFSSQGFSSTLWSLACIGHTPSPAFVDAACKHIKHCNMFKSFKNVDVATTLYSAARMQIQLTLDAYLELQGVLTSVMFSLHPKHLANSGLAMSQLVHAHPHHPPPPISFIAKYVKAVHTSLSYLNSRDISMVCQALARFKCQLPPMFLSALQSRIESIAAEFKPQDIALTLWALSRLGGKPSPTLMVEFFMATDRRLSSFKPQELSMMIWAVAQTDVQLERSWIEEFLHCTFFRLPDFSTQGLANMIMGIAKLNIKPTPAWLYAFVKAATTALPSCSLYDVQTLIAGLSQLNDAPSGMQLQKVDEFLQEAKAVLQAKVQVMGGLGVARNGVPSSAMPDPSDLAITAAAQELASIDGFSVYNNGVQQPDVSIESLRFTVDGRIVSPEAQQDVPKTERSVKRAAARRRAYNKSLRQGSHTDGSTHTPEASQGVDRTSELSVRSSSGKKVTKQRSRSRSRSASPVRSGQAASPEAVLLPDDGQTSAAAMQLAARNRKVHKAAALKVAKAAGAGLVGPAQAMLLTASNAQHTTSRDS